MPFDPNDEVTISLSAIEWQHVLLTLQKAAEMQQFVSIFQRFTVPSEITTALHSKINIQAISQMPQQAPNITSMRGDGVSDPVSAAK